MEEIKNLEKEYEELKENMKVKEWVSLSSQISYLSSQYFWNPNDYLEKEIDRLSAERENLEKVYPEVKRFVELREKLLPIWTKKSVENFVKAVEGCKMSRSIDEFKSCIVKRLSEMKKK
ncbi:MAG: hypothetical protein B6U78_03050 [Candidatus Aenigmarchaeota archaeon ex4484_224]|nr:MAG: hypothetical protein B6U78_03050 [Candidatus Aenigmarchaeota archaeon ex4484_224]